MSKADKIDIIVSFLMESGVRMLLKDLRAALDRDVQVRILTGNYLGINILEYRTMEYYRRRYTGE